MDEMQLPIPKSEIVTVQFEGESKIIEAIEGFGIPAPAVQVDLPSGGYQHVKYSAADYDITPFGVFEKGERPPSFVVGANTARAPVRIYGCKDLWNGANTARCAVATQRLLSGN